MVIWADYSGGYPGAASLRAAGFTGAIRYIGEGGSGKRLTASERADFDANGFPYLLVCELDVTDAEGGYSRGQAFAQAALADARAKGVPDSIGIACAADEHLATSLIPAAVEYARGFKDVLGHERTGAYGFSEFVSAIHAAGHASWFWQAGNPPDVTGTTAFVNFWQRNGYDHTPTVSYVSGIQCDINNQLIPRTATAVIRIEDEDDMGHWMRCADDAGNETGSGLLLDNGDFLGLPIPKSIKDAQGYCNLNDGTDGAGAAGRWQDLVTRYGNSRAKAGQAFATALKADGVGTVTVDPAVVQAAVTTALKGLSLSVSPADQTAIANAVVTVLGQKLSTPKAA